MAHFKASLFLTTLLLAALLLVNSALEPAAAKPAASVYMPVTATPAEEYVFSHSWGAEGNQIRSPEGVAVAKDGTVYIANTGLDRITKISSATGPSIFNNWGESGSGDEQFLYMVGIAVDEDDNVYGVDGGEWEPNLGLSVIGNNRIQKFSSSGDFQIKWGSKGTEIGEFLAPSGVAVDGDGNVYVADSINHRIQKFNSSGGPLAQWGSSGNGEGQFRYPGGIAVTEAGAEDEVYVYVADSGNDRIQKFVQKVNESSGVLEIKYDRQWGGCQHGFTSFPDCGIAVDQDGNVYVADTGNHRIQKFSSSGAYLTQWGSEGTEKGQFYSPSGIAVSEAGNVYVADTGNDRIQKFEQKVNESNGVLEIKYERQWGGSDGSISNPNVIAVGADGYAYVVDTWNHRIQKFNSSGAYLTQWGSEGSGEGQFRWPRGIAVDRFGNVYVADSINHRIQKFEQKVNESSGVLEIKYDRQWGSYGSGDGQFYYPENIAVDGDSNVYVTDDTERIQKFSSSGAYLTQWGSEGSGDGQFIQPGRIAIDGDGNVYVGDSYNDRIQKFDSSGKYERQWDGCHNENGFLSFPDCGIAVDVDDNVYVADFAYDRIQKFTSSGILMTKWGSEGSKIGEFKWPGGIAVDGDGNVFVADLGNHRIQVFSSTYPAPDPTSGLVLNGSFENSPPLTHWSYRGNLSLREALVAGERHGNYMLQLDVLDPDNQPLSEASAHQTFFIPEKSHPTLSFDYKMVANDIKDWSDFFVTIQDGSGLTHKATVLRDGYVYSDPHHPSNLPWQSHACDLSAFAGQHGQHIRVVFASRNLHPGSEGILTYVDDVRVVDAGQLPGDPLPPCNIDP